MKVDTIIILDFGGQYSHLIARRIRELNVFSEVVPADISTKEFENLKNEFKIKGIILSGGPSSVYDDKSPKINRLLLNGSIPILGLCYGHQLIALISGGEVRPGKKREYGVSKVEVNNQAGILKGLKKYEKVWMSHTCKGFQSRHKLHRWLWSPTMPPFAAPENICAIRGTQDLGLDTLQMLLWQHQLPALDRKRLQE